MNPSKPAVFLPTELKVTANSKCSLCPIHDLLKKSTEVYNQLINAEEQKFYRKLIDIDRINLN